MRTQVCHIIHMNTALLKIKKFARLLAAFAPSALPIGMTAFTDWADDIIDLYDLPNNDSIRFSLASMVMHLGPTSAFKPKFHFFLMVRAGMAKQIASANFQEIKFRQQAAYEAQQKAAQDAALNETPKATT